MRTLRFFKSYLPLAALSLMLQGCFSFSTPEYVLQHRDAIQKNEQVNVDISDASSFMGNVNGVLNDIEEQVAPLPERFREKMGTIKVVDGFFSAYAITAPFVRAYTDSDGTIYLRNANPFKYLQQVVLLTGSDELAHELVHSVHFYEMAYWKKNKKPTPEFADFIKAWECQYLGDVNKDGAIDDRDIAYIYSHPKTYDTDKNGTINSHDVEALAGAPYVSGNWASLRGLHVMAWMSLQWIAPRPTGFATPYAKTYVWEDAAETNRYLWDHGYVPGLYRQDKTSEKAWKKFAKLQKKDPLLARKVYLVARYIAAHEDPVRLSSAWKHYALAQSGSHEQPAVRTAQK